MCMETLERIGRLLTRMLSWGMKGVGLASAGNQLLLHPAHASSLQLLLSGILLMGGQATKDLLLGLIDRLLAPSHTPVEPAAPPKEPAP